MHPSVGWRLAHLTLQRVHRWQGMGLLRDYKKQKGVFKALHPPCGTATAAALAWCAGAGQRVRIPWCLGILKRRQPLRKLVQR